MSAHACRMIWDAAGRPDPTEAPSGEGRCAHCGLVGPMSMRLGPNFTDYRLLADVTGRDMCPACSWCLGGKPPLTLRMWTTMVRLDQPAGQPALPKPPYVSGPHLCLTNRKDMRLIVDILVDPPADGSPWLVAVAETGQRHTAPFTPVNRGRGEWTVRMDGMMITSNPGEWRVVFARVAALRDAGFSAESIETGRPHFAALKDGLDAWRTHAPHLGAWQATDATQGAPLLRLANLMITKETNGHYLAAYPV